MQPYQRFWLLLSFIFLASPVFSQKYKKELDKINVLFYQKKYSEAYWQYKQLYQKHSDDKSILLKMADCNYLVENFPVAQGYYAQYFSDTIYSDIEQFTNYAIASKRIGKVLLASKLYQKIYEAKQDPEAKANFEMYKLYGDSADKIRSYNLDSNYACIELDANESWDSLAAPLAYVWDLGDGVVTEGRILKHCFLETGFHKIILSVRDIHTGVLHVNDTSVTVYVEAPPVTFAILTKPDKRVKNLSVDFDAGSTTIKDHDIVDYVWDMGNHETVRGKKIRYRYNNMGLYNVKLTVLAEDRNTKAKQLFSSWKTIEVFDSYKEPSKTFSDTRNAASK